MRLRCAGAREIKPSRVLPFLTWSECVTPGRQLLTNISKHARGTLAQVRVAGAPNRGLHVCVRNPRAVGAHERPAPPGSGTGLLGLRERVTLANGVLVHGPDASGDFVVEADLPW